MECWWLDTREVKRRKTKRFAVQEVELQSHVSERVLACVSVCTCCELVRVFCLWVDIQTNIFHHHYNYCMLHSTRESPHQRLTKASSAIKTKLRNMFQTCLTCIVIFTEQVTCCGFSAQLYHPIKKSNKLWSNWTKEKLFMFCHNYKQVYETRCVKPSTYSVKGGVTLFNLFRLSYKHLFLPP